jgi:EamA-like transporter family protein
MRGQNSEVEVPGAVFALSAAALFGASTPAAKLLLRDLSPLMLSALLYLGAAIALSAHRFLLGIESREAQVTRRDLPLICGIIFFGGMLGPILMLLGLQYLSAVTGSLLLNLEGPFTVLITVGLMRVHFNIVEQFSSLSTDKRRALGRYALCVVMRLTSLMQGTLFDEMLEPKEPYDNNARHRYCARIVDTRGLRGGAGRGRPFVLEDGVSTTPIPPMRADRTVSGERTSGSTAPPRGATRQATGGTATTSTTSAEPSYGSCWHNRGRTS